MIRQINLLYGAAILSLLAAMIHAFVMADHLAEWWGYGGFLIVAAAAQGLLAFSLVAWPGSRVAVAGILVNLAIVALWGVSRWIGVPWLGPAAGEVKAIGLLDLLATGLEVLTIVLLGLALELRIPVPRRSATA